MCVYQCHLSAPSALPIRFPTILNKNVAFTCRTIFINKSHYHNKTHAATKMNSKRQHGQNSGLERLIFIFLLCVLFFYVAPFFPLREMERDMPFLPPCALLWSFSGLFFCMAPALSNMHTSLQSSGSVLSRHVNTVR